MAVTRGTLQIARRLRRDIGTEVDDAARTLTREWIAAWDDLTARWVAAADELVTAAVQLGRWPRPAELLRMERVDTAMRGSIAALDKLAERTETVAADGADRVVQLDANYEDRIVASQAPKTEEPGLSAMLATRTDQRAVEALREAWALREQARDDLRLTVKSRIRTDAIDVITARTGRQIHASTLPLSPQAVDSMRRELVRGIDVGDNPRQAAARMVDGVQGQFNGGLTRALNISRTEMLDAYRTTSQQIHAANADVVPGWSWLATFDPRVCPSCLALHGSQYPVSQPGPEDHQQGRCSRLPVLASWAELGIQAPEPPSAMPDAQEWFARQSRAVQLRVMGPGRLQLLDDGAIGWGDLSRVRQTPGWRPSRVPTPVRDLRRRADRGLPPTPRPVGSIPPPVVRPRLATTTLPAPTPRPRLATTQLPLPARPVPAPVPRVWLAAPTLPLPAAPQPQWITPDEAVAMQNEMLGRSGDWTDDQRDALVDYTGHAYTPMNGWLRYPQYRLSGPEWDRAANVLIPNAAAAMRPLPRRVTVSRATKADAFGFEEWDRDALLGMVGRTVQDPGFMSTTINRSYHSKDGGTAISSGSIELVIDVPAGYPAAYVGEISQFRGERELLLQAGTRLRIIETAVTEGGGVHMRAVVLP